MISWLSYAAVVILVVTWMSGCATSGTKRIVEDRSLMEECVKLPPLRKGDDPVANHIEVTRAYHKCAINHLGLIQTIKAREQK